MAKDFLSLICIVSFPASRDGWCVVVAGKIARVLWESWQTRNNDRHMSTTTFALGGTGPCHLAFNIQKINRRWWGSPFIKIYQPINPLNYLGHGWLQIFEKKHHLILHICFTRLSKILLRWKFLQSKICEFNPIIELKNIWSCIFLLKFLRRSKCALVGKRIFFFFVCTCKRREDQTIDNR